MSDKSTSRDASEHSGLYISFQSGPTLLFKAWQFDFVLVRKALHLEKKDRTKTHQTKPTEHSKNILDYLRYENYNIIS